MICVCLHAHAHAHDGKGVTYIQVQMPSEATGINSPGAEVIGDCKLPDLGTLHEQFMFLTLSHLFSPKVSQYLSCWFATIVFKESILFLTKLYIHLTLIILVCHRQC